MADLTIAEPAGVRLDRPLIGSDTGPAWIDAETVASFARLYQAGNLVFPPELTREVLDVSLDQVDIVELTAIFGRHVASSTADGAPSLLLLRTVALFRALRDTAESYLSGLRPAGGVLVPNAAQLLVAREGVEDHVESLRAKYRDLAGVDVIAMVSPKQLADLTGITENQWGVWRLRGLGPRFLKPTPRTVRYLVGDVLSWIADTLPAVDATR